MGAAERDGQGRADRSTATLVEGRLAQVDGSGRSAVNDDIHAMLEAHVRFELARWRGAGFEDLVGQEIAALFGWLAGTPLDEVVTAGEVTGLMRRVVAGLPISDELVELIEEGVNGGYDALVEEATRLDELLPRDGYERFVDLVVAAQSIRDVVTAQITGSEIYAQLVAHLLYKGIKSYLLTQNVVARRVPGAGSLLRLGQSALSSAGLDKGIDRQLAAFVAAEARDTIRDSKAFLDEALDDAMIRTIADEVWVSNGARTVPWAVGLLGREPLTDAVTAGRDVWLWLRESDFFLRVATRLVDAFFERHGPRPVTDLLTAIGVTEDLLTREVVLAAVPAVARADRSGLLEKRIRAHLEPFYASYDGAAAPPPRAQRARGTAKGTSGKAGAGKAAPARRTSKPTG